MDIRQRDIQLNSKGRCYEKREKYEKFLKSIEILSTVEPFELTQICDELRRCFFKSGDFVINEGELGDVFYLIEEGRASALKTAEPGTINYLKYRKAS